MSTNAMTPDPKLIYNVRDHGQPPKRAWVRRDGGPWRVRVGGRYADDVEWRVPQSPTEVAPPPVPPPGPWWTVDSEHLMSLVRPGGRVPGLAEAAAEVLNAWERGDVVWPERLRPLSELPEDGYVLAVWSDGSMGSRRRHELHHESGVAGWLPLPDEGFVRRWGAQAR